MYIHRIIELGFSNILEHKLYYKKIRTITTLVYPN